MKILYYDCFSGISGDMNLGALIDLGVPKEYLIGELSKLNITGYEIEVSKDNRKGITGTKVTVKLDSEEHAHHEEEQYHNHSHEHIHNKCNVHNQNSKNGKQGQQEHVVHTHEHEHRNLEAIEAIIDNSSLKDRVKKISKEIFLKVAKAEAKIHGKSLKEVHFHEVGAVDSIVDIIGAAICLDYLKVDKVLAASVELGGGFVKCAHGTFPVPAPATAEILKGIPVKLGAVQVETTTPTGAAILAATVIEFTNKKEFTINKIAYGIGHRDTVIPNVLRVYLGELDEKAAALNETAFTGDETDYEEALMLECNIDDMNPELYDYTMESLFDAGAMDVFLTPIIMKKGRPAVKIGVLCNVNIEKALTDILLKETTTLGVRKYKVEKSMLKREFSIINTKYGAVKVKTSILNGEKIKSKPEYDDCKRIAKERNIPISAVYEEVKLEINN